MSQPMLTLANIHAITNLGSCAWSKLAAFGRIALAPVAVDRLRLGDCALACLSFVKFGSCQSSVTSPLSTVLREAGWNAKRRFGAVTPTNVIMRESTAPTVKRYCPEASWNRTRNGFALSSPLW